MPKKTIEIKIIGESATGKTSIASLITRVLENLEFEVDHKLDNDYPSKLDRASHIEPMLPQALFTIKDKTKIVIKEEHFIKRFQ